MSIRSTTPKVCATLVIIQWADKTWLQLVSIRIESAMPKTCAKLVTSGIIIKLGLEENERFNLTATNRRKYSIYFI